MSDNSSIEGMSKRRLAFFPISNRELKKFLPMSIILMAILFNYTIMRDLKDTIVVTSPISPGSSVTSFLKFWVVMPAAFLFVICYSKLTNVVSSEKVFYIVVVCFLFFFVLYGFVLSPYQELIHPNQTFIKDLQYEYPRFASLIAIGGMWAHSLFYVVSELWGSSMIALLFWKFANDIIKTEEAKRFYPLFGLIANLALIFSGYTIKHFSSAYSHLGGIIGWNKTLHVLTLFMVIAGVVCVLVYRWMHTNVLTDPQYYTPPKKTKKKPKLSLKESFQYITSSPYLGLIALLIICYGVSIHMVEVVWKQSLKEYTNGPNKFAEFMGNYSLATGIATIILILFFKNTVRRLGWRVAALITPFVLGGTGILFLSIVLFSDNIEPVFAHMGITALTAAAFFGATQGILSKGIKYSMFDPTKEMSYIPLDEEMKSKGKAAVDVIGGRLGKGLGSLMMQGIYFTTGINNPLELSYIIMFFVVAIILLWLSSIFKLNIRYQKLINPEGKKA